VLRFVFLENMVYGTSGNMDDSLYSIVAKWISGGNRSIKNFRQLLWKSPDVSENSLDFSGGKVVCCSV